MRISLRDAFLQKYTCKGLSRRLRRHLKQTAAFLTIGLATAWGGEASAVTLEVSVTPERALTDTYGLFYHTNSSIVERRFLGSFFGGGTTAILLDFPATDPEDFEGIFRGYVILGLYDDVGGPSVAVSFPDDSPIVNGSEWDDEFPAVSEQEVAQRLMTDPGRLISFVFPHESRLKTRFGTEATIVNFSEAAFGGVVTARVIPEPASAVLLITGTGVCVLLRRRRG